MEKIYIGNCIGSAKDHHPADLDGLRLFAVWTADAQGNCARMENLPLKKGVLVKTDKVLELMAHFRMSGVPTDTGAQKLNVSLNPRNGGLEKVLQWQDLLGQSTLKQISEFEKGLCPFEQGLFMMINLHCLSLDTVESIIDATVVRRRNIPVEELEELQGQNSLLKEQIIALEEKNRLLEKAQANLVIEKECATRALEKMTRSLSVLAQFADHFKNGVTSEAILRAGRK